MEERELLAMVGEERRSSIGFQHDQELAEKRAKALDYVKGEMPDLVSLPNRSKAVSSDVSDAVETILPDLLEIFMGGEDIASFRPIGPEDEKLAEQETDYVNHVVMQENDGFNVLYAAFKDALTVDTGVFHWYWEANEETEEESWEGVDAVTLQSLVANGWEITEATANEDGSYNAKGQKTEADGCLEVCAVPPEDFTVGRDTVNLKEATYCAMRTRSRAQDLIADGYDEDKVKALATYGANNDNTVQTSRDNADEGQDGINQSGNLRLVEVVVHYLKVYEGSKETIYRVVTGNNEDVLLEQDTVDMIPFSAITPYPTAHRFYGRSVADLVMEVQRIKTALMRMFLDSGYFAMNQRFEVATSGANEWTIPDLMRNEPGMPVRSNSGQTIRPISAGGFQFPALEALEYMSTVMESRTGIVRNAQGLKPDTLHDTASGAAALMSAAQKRVRMIARIFAETGVKDMFLGVHATLRAHATKERTAKMRGEWVPVNPSKWGNRDDMTIEIGVGSGGKDQELMMYQAGTQIIQQLVQMQGGPTGPIVKIDNIYAFAKKSLEKLGFKTADLFLSDPAKQQPQQEGPPAPDPKMVEVQQKAQIEQAKLQQQGALEREKMVAQAQLKREQLDAEFELKRYQIEMEARMQSMGGDIRFGGEVG